MKSLDAIGDFVLQVPQSKRGVDERRREGQEYPDEEDQKGPDHVRDEVTTGEDEEYGEYGVVPLELPRDNSLVSDVTEGEKQHRGNQEPARHFYGMYHSNDGEYEDGSEEVVGLVVE